MQRDIVLKQYLSDDTRFADLINGVIGRGKQLVSPEQLEDRDSQVTEQLPVTPHRAAGHRGRYVKLRPRYRDAARKAAFGMNFIVVGVENQEHTHYLMPLRCMGYDVREYERQARGRGKQLLDDYRTKRIALTDEEYLSRFSKEDRLHPCITLVLFFGKDWDGAIGLHQLLDMDGIPEEFRPYINDYPVHILPVRQLRDTEVFQSDLRQVFDGIRYADDKEKFRKHVLENPAFRDLEEDACEVIRQYIHSQELETIMAKQQEKKEEGGNADMCRAITELIEEGREEGRAEGIDLLEKLVSYLLRDKRLADLERMTQTAAYRDALLREYGLVALL